MLRIGLTGGIGSGKSVIRDMLARKGARIFDADSVAKELMISDPGVMDGLRSLLGNDAWRDDGSLNRAWIAEKVFSDDALRESLNAIVHPAVHRAFVQAARKAELEGAPAIVREAALLPSTAQRGHLDRIVAVLAPEEDRIDRVMGRDGVSRADVEARMAAQPDNDDYAGVADDIIDNAGSLQHLETTIDTLWKQWMYNEESR